MSFVHLHNHTHYSLLDGLAKVDEYLGLCKEYGLPAMAITDHGVMYGAIEFYQKFKAASVKPIIGCEAYITDDRKVKDPSARYNHIVLLAKNEKGYKNLMKITTLAHLEGFYYKPRLDFEILEKYGDGIIATSACLAGDIPKALLSGDQIKARELVTRYQKILGKDSFFLELQHHPEIEDWTIVNDMIVQLSKVTGAPMVATNDCHYARKEDSVPHDVLLCIQLQRTVHEEDRMKYIGDFSMRDPKELAKYFDKISEDCMKNTLAIADQCNLEIKFGENKIPSFKTPENKNPNDYLKELCEIGLKERYGDNPKAAERLTYELSIINRLGFSTYFLIVHDFVKYAKSQGIVVGPGRGSAAGSIISYSLGITELDPLSYNLLFERFLNPARVSMPDIDIDFADNRRDDVLEYVVNKYGDQNVAQIVTFGTMTAKAAVRDAGRALGHSYGDVDKISKMIPPMVLGKHAPLKISVKNDPELKQAYEKDETAKQILDMAIKLEGTIRHAGTHACAVVISDEPLTEYTPLQKPTGDKVGIVTQYSMKPIADLGLLKMDFLGLKNLTILQTALGIVKRTKGVEVDLKALPMEDAKTFELMAQGRTTGVFQFESGGMKRYLKELKPSHINDLIAMNALYRPGPMEWIPNYIKGKHNAQKIKYLHESLEPILKDTYGVVVFQEQIMTLAQVFSGLELGEAYLLLKGIAKKDPKIVKEMREKFINGAVANRGHTKKLAEDMFEKVVEPFAGYGFNKSHSACYALIAYQTAYMKAHYSVAFMAALLTSDSGDTDRVVIEINECEEIGIKVLPPDINESRANFTAVDDSTIRFGLCAIKGIGENAVKEIIDVRTAGGAFKSMEDFAERVPIKILNKKTIEALAYSGAFNCIGDGKQIAENTEDISTFAKSIQASKVEGQIDMFGELATASLKLKESVVPTFYQKLLWEKKYLGLYVSGHPLQGLSKYIKKKALLVNQITKRDIGKRVHMVGIVANYKKSMTKSGGYMASFTLEDPTGKINAVVFPKVFQKYQHIFVEDALVVMSGKLDNRRGDLQFMCEEAKIVSLDKMIENAKTDNLFVPDEKVLRHVVKLETEETEIEDISLEEPITEPVEVMPYIIEIPEKCLGCLPKIKELLVKNSGDTHVEIHIVGEGEMKKIKVPVTVNIGEEVKEEINKLIVR
ncbi:MAG: polymerase III catalytic subunit, DnaE type, DNA polymerase III subunit alpha protein [Candidatus Peregrinibacteria bacterium GW2011_GWF2_43_17]|nr:MAG: polymerase III catalytic subunit, DnaE type, DNA polymerase III subunit alpha protein [Candidatus Peregrinibacteria bacterium GW2011_GWF2_43_17]HAU39720.1 DNA polymerase III subunit alpha [Candidatus Peregrinibacteria bacterium]